ncbi:uncharacterized protein [Dermacentor albipictus]|uniref:uncharacterized protein n=1 Tax=Dermacentor albipictus TaxID=60249 RepID=UPI0031FC8540
MDDAAPTPAVRGDTTFTPPVIAAELPLPRSWPENPRLWFMQIDTRFQRRRITSQTARYLHVVAALSSDIAGAIDDLLAATPSAATYDDLKRIVLQRLKPSQQSRLQRPLSEGLGDQRPSQHLHRLSQLLNDHPENESQLPILRELFLRRLPHVVLAGSDEASLDRLAVLADHIYDCTSAAQLTIAAARISEPGDRLSRLEETVDYLTSTLEKLTVGGNINDQLRHNHSPSQSRSVPRDSSQQLFRYHRRFLEQASRCIQTCSWTRNAQASR